MKTPTILVRLIGLYMLVQCSVGLIQLYKFKSAVGVGMLGRADSGTVTQMQTLLIAGFIVGVVATIWAGLLARVLTFDAEARPRRSGLYRDGP